MSTRTEHIGVEFASALFMVAVTTSVCWALSGRVSETDLVMIYLVGVVSFAGLARMGPSLVGSVGAVAAFDFFFTTPYFTLKVDESRYLITFCVMAVVGVSVSVLTGYLRTQLERSRKAERDGLLLAELGRALVSSVGVDEIVASARGHMEVLFDGEARLVMGGAQARRLGAEVPIELDGAEVGRIEYDGERRPLARSAAALVALALERDARAEQARASGLELEVEQTRGALLSSISHDLRTPLGSIMGAASTLKEEGVVLSEQVREELLGMIEAESHRLSRLLSNLLEMTRFESSVVRLDLQVHVPEEVIGASIRAARVAAPGRDLRAVVAPDVGFVSMDALLVEQALVNLLENAIKYSPAPSPCTVEVTREGDAVRFAVLDRGPGVPEAARLHVFERFWRAQGVDDVKGAGLGLAIVRAVALAHGGEAAVGERADGLPGAAFSLTIPSPPVDLDDPMEES